MNDTRYDLRPPYICYNLLLNQAFVLGHLIFYFYFWIPTIVANVLLKSYLRFFCHYSILLAKYHGFYEIHADFLKILLFGVIKEDVYFF